jgi:hypothetical protein
LIDINNVDTLSSELETRLDDLFDESALALPDAQDKNLEELYPLAELKNLILSIDWEITDEVLDNLLQQLKDLQLTYKHDKIVLTFLQILSSLGSYIKSQRSKAHPRTFKILNSVFSSLDKVVLNKDMAEAAKMKMLRTEMNRYKELRVQIANSKTGDLKHKTETKPDTAKSLKINTKKIPQNTTPDAPSQTPAQAAADQSVSDQESQRDAAVTTLDQAVAEIRRHIQTEMNALKKEVQSLRKQISECL